MFSLFISESADIIFQYPDRKCETRDSANIRQDILVQIRGIFMTLNQLLSEILSLNVVKIAKKVFMLNFFVDVYIFFNF